jgi:hypothetical protein
MKILVIFMMFMILFFSINKIVYWFKGNKKKNDLTKIIEVYFLEHTFKVDIKKVGINKIINIVALSNALIFTIVLMSTMLISNFFIRIFVMFIMLIPLIYLVYYSVSKLLNKKGTRDNV